MYKERILTGKLRKLHEVFPVAVVSGARQVGKTTLLRHVFPNYDYAVFDPSIDLENARGEPDLFLRNHPAPVVLDEVQYAPELVSAVKRQVDTSGSRAGMYLMSGSQQWQVLRSLAESPAGRGSIIHWHSAGGAEVDLLLERDGVLHPFEMRLTANPSVRDVSGVTAFRRAHRHLQIGTAALLCAVDRPRWVTEDTTAIPWNTI